MKPRSSNIEYQTPLAYKQGRLHAHSAEVHVASAWRKNCRGMQRVLGICATSPPT